ncbi:uncharacterized protein G2W53_039584 [Senna tora]|uniref:Uncharacterized protein n=1 Tax=Senna tora TaxID=362788 RepID=A0A834W3Q2_9FABA|nr:uncharacterized protein G2W53_039584 [Senna tora]
MGHRDSKRSRTNHPSTSSSWQTAPEQQPIPELVMDFRRLDRAITDLTHGMKVKEVISATVQADIRELQAGSTSARGDDDEGDGDEEDIEG